MRARFAVVFAITFFMFTGGLEMSAQSSTAEQQVTVDLAAPAHPLPHFWDEMFGSGRAILSLRSSYRHDLRAVKQATDMRYVRFHGILMDEVGVYSEDAKGNPVYNFSYVDQIYDGLLKNGVKPFVELSFMPKDLSSDPAALHAFWYKPNVAPPKDWNKWADFIKAFTQHLVDRYGIDEVSTWYFEVWNEPNLDFWVGNPKQETYFKLYDVTAKAIKSVSPRLRVGGPATAQAAWVSTFIRHCEENHIPLDFVSSHVYGNDSAENVFHTNEVIPRDKMVCRAVGKVHDEILASSMPHLPLIWSEFNASYMNEPNVTDSIYMGPWMADTIRQCDGKVNMMSYWTFSDVFEEQGVIKQPFYGGFGLMAEDGIPKASFNAFALLHKLGDERIENKADDVLVTKRKDGTVVLAVWNLVNPGDTGAAKTVALKLEGKPALHEATIYRVDDSHGDPMSAYKRMGSPRYPTQKQIEELIEAAKLPAPKREAVSGTLRITLPVNGLAVVELH